MPARARIPRGCQENGQRLSMICPVEQGLQGQLEIISGIKLRWYGPTEAQENKNQDAENKTKCKGTQREATLRTPGRRG